MFDLCSSWPLTSSTLRRLPPVSVFRPRKCPSAASQLPSGLRGGGDPQWSQFWQQSVPCARQRASCPLWDMKGAAYIKQPQPRSPHVSRWGKGWTPSPGCWPAHFWPSRETDPSPDCLGSLPFIWLCPGWGAEAGVEGSSALSPMCSPALPCVPQGQEAVGGQWLCKAFLGLGSDALGSGLELVFGLGPPLAAGEIFDFKGETPQAPFRTETLKVLGWGREPRVRGQRRGREGSSSGSEGASCPDHSSQPSPPWPPWYKTQAQAHLFGVQKSRRQQNGGIRREGNPDSGGGQRHQGPALGRQRLTAHQPVVREPEHPARGPEHVGRRQLGLGVEAGNVVRGCGSKGCCEGLGKAGRWPAQFRWP